MNVRYQVTLRPSSLRLRFLRVCQTTYLPKRKSNFLACKRDVFASITKGYFAFVNALECNSKQAFYA